MVWYSRDDAVQIGVCHEQWSSAGLSWMSLAFRTADLRSDGIRRYSTT
jgi:hypothetical protein